MKLLLIGANGYIGSILASRLVRKYGEEAVDLVDIGLSETSYGEGALVMKRDFRDFTIEELSSYSDCIWVAGHSSVLQSINDPMGCFANNLTGLVEFEKKFNGRLIYASSGSVYNNSIEKVCEETSLLGPPQNIYDYTKSSFDQYLSIEGKNLLD